MRPAFDTEALASRLEIEALTPEAWISRLKSGTPRSTMMTSAKRGKDGVKLRVEEEEQGCG